MGFGGLLIWGGVSCRMRTHSAPTNWKGEPRSRAFYSVHGSNTMPAGIRQAVRAGGECSIVAGKQTSASREGAPAPRCLGGKVYVDCAFHLRPSDISSNSTGRSTPNTASNVSLSFLLISNAQGYVCIPDIPPGLGRLNSVGQANSPGVGSTL